MDFFELATLRRSVRSYEDKEVPKEKLNKILECARVAPSACNRQPWHLIVVTDEKTRAMFEDAYAKEWFYTAPVIICICGIESEAWCRSDGKNYFDVDLAIAFDHLTLSAAEEGLGTCWIGAFKPDIVRKILNLPDNVVPIALTPLGFPKDKKVEKKRKNLNEIVHWNKW